MRFVLVCALAVVAWQGGAQDTQKPAEEKGAADSKAPAGAAKIVNPTKAAPESIALGKKAYGTDCAMCHGKTGAGDGDLAVDMKLKLKDYRDAAALKEMTDGEIYTIILNGKGQMSGEEGRMKPGQIWDVVNYVRSLGKGK
jgi:mono/diheme cytochrome c family protein